jgi:hypothetical protein
MPENKSKYFSNNIIQYHADLAIKQGWQVMTRDAYDYVSLETVWEDRDEMWYLVKILINEVGKEIILRNKN